MLMLKLLVCSVLFASVVVQGTDLSHVKKVPLAELPAVYRTMDGTEIGTEPKKFVSRWDENVVFEDHVVDDNSHIRAYRGTIEIIRKRNENEKLADKNINVSLDQESNNDLDVSIKEEIKQLQGEIDKNKLEILAKKKEIEELKKSNTDLDDLKKQVEEIKQKKDEIEENAFTLNEEGILQKKEIKDLKTKIKKINQSIANTGIEHLAKIEEYTKKMENKDQEISSYQKAIGIIGGCFVLMIMIFSYCYKSQNNTIVRDVPKSRNDDNLLVNNNEGLTFDQRQQTRIEIREAMEEERKKKKKKKKKTKIEDEPWYATSFFNTGFFSFRSRN